MRVPIEWLHEYCAPDLPVGELAEVLALTGTEVERVERHGVRDPDGFVVGRVLTREKHPDADRLSVCTVDIGDGAPRQIVCGAPNVAAGLTVGVVTPGSVMPDGVKLKRSKLRGVESDGMILSERELGISTEHDGIMVLEDGLAPGTPLERAAPIGTDVLVLEITPNRPDCLGIYGVAREVHAATGAELRPPPWDHDPGTPGDLEGITITTEVPELNPRFTARVFANVRIGPSPRWLKARLMAAGQRPISNVVDITNYVMLLTGQPMHAFDLDRVAGRRLNVRRARAGERMTTLDGQVRELDGEMLVIEDAEGPTSLAGVMGGERSEVSDATVNVLSEVATWDGPNIHRTSVALGLRSEASGRFEKGLAPEQATWAQVVATRLFTEIAGATVRPGTIDLGGPGPAPAVIRLRHARVEGLLGARLDRERLADPLRALGFTCQPTRDGFDVTVPDFRRADVTREVDLIEEVARLVVLRDLPATLPARRSAVGSLSPRQRLRRRAADLLAGQGLHEVIGWSFTSPQQNERLRLAAEPVRLANPMSSEGSVLRTTLLGSVLEIAARNRARGAQAIRIFEIGAVYRPAEGIAQKEDTHLLALLAGPVRPATWREPNPRDADFYTAKGAALALLRDLGLELALEPGPAMPALHPARSMTLHSGSDRVGFIAEVHPSVVSAFGLEGTVATFALNLDRLPLPEVRHYRELSPHPEVREDLAVVVEETVTAAAVLEAVRRAGRPLLESVEVFDVYRDAQRLGPGRVSLALRLHYRAADRTLTDEEVAARRAKIIDALGRELGGSIRA
jgi:phenylalanyl-tRNA synthetase beta chain